MLGDGMVEIDTNLRTKVSIKLFDGGKISTYNHLMSTIAIAVLQMADKPDQASDAVMCVRRKLQLNLDLHFSREIWC